jgi:hypothetical protein
MRSTLRQGCVYGLRVLAAALLVMLVTPAGGSASDARASAKRGASASSIDPDVLALALRAASCAKRKQLLGADETLTVIDYSRPSTSPRLWVLDLHRGEVLFEELVAHGRESGANRATRFSNEVGSHQSSLGLFVTLDEYVGRHGRSLRLAGLEPGVNDRALERALVIHGADYVSKDFGAKHGRLGRSFGCAALSRDTAPKVIDRIRGGSAVFAYYPDPAWLASSSFLGSCEQQAKR